MTPQQPADVWKILLVEQATSFLETGIFDGSADDRRDGFIHLSTLEQLSGTIAKHFSCQTRLVAVSCPADRLDDALRWEASRKGALFPHLYRPLVLDDVRHIIPATPRWIEALPQTGV